MTDGGFKSLASALDTALDMISDDDPTRRQMGIVHAVGIVEQVLNRFRPPRGRESLCRRLRQASLDGLLRYTRTLDRAIEMRNASAHGVTTLDLEECLLVRTELKQTYDSLVIHCSRAEPVSPAPENTVAPIGHREVPDAVYAPPATPARRFTVTLSVGNCSVCAAPAGVMCGVCQEFACADHRRFRTARPSEHVVCSACVPVKPSRDSDDGRVGRRERPPNRDPQRSAGLKFDLRRELAAHRPTAKPSRPDPWTPLESAGFATSPEQRALAVQIAELLRLPLPWLVDLATNYHRPDRTAARQFVRHLVVGANHDFEGLLGAFLLRDVDAIRRSARVSWTAEIRVAPKSRTLRCNSLGPAGPGDASDAGADSARLEQAGWAFLNGVTSGSLYDRSWLEDSGVPVSVPHMVMGYQLPAVLMAPYLVPFVDIMVDAGVYSFDDGGDAPWLGAILAVHAKRPSVLECTPVSAAEFVMSVFDAAHRCFRLRWEALTSGGLPPPDALRALWVDRTIQASTETVLRHVATGEIWRRSAAEHEAYLRTAVATGSADEDRVQSVGAALRLEGARRAEVARHVPGIISRSSAVLEDAHRLADMDAAALTIERLETVSLHPALELNFDVRVPEGPVRGPVWLAFWETDSAVAEVRAAAAADDAWRKELRRALLERARQAFPDDVPGWVRSRIHAAVSASHAPMILLVRKRDGLDSTHLRTIAMSRVIGMEDVIGSLEAAVDLLHRGSPCRASVTKGILKAAVVEAFRISSNHRSTNSWRSDRPKNAVDRIWSAVCDPVTGARSH